MHRTSRLFLYALLADGFIVLAMVFFGGLRALSAADTVLSLSLTLAAVGLYLSMCLSPRVSKADWLLPTLFVFWATMGAFPVSLWWDKSANLIVALLQITLAGFFLTRQRSRRLNRKWFNDLHRPPLFTFKNLFLSAAMTAAVVALFGGIFIHAGTVLIAKKTAGYVTVHPSGAFLEERHFVKEGKEVRLLAMVHVAQRGFYEEIAKALLDKKSAVVLMEGVSDSQGLLKKKFGYSNLASQLGLTAQTESAFQTAAVAAATAPEPSSAAPAHIEYQSADIDISAFQPNTIRFLEAVGALFASHTLAEALLQIQDPASPLKDDSQATAVMGDILDLRNAHLLGELDKALPDFDTIIIPWGALHLPFIQGELEKRGFVETRRISRQAFAFFKKPLK